MQLLINLLSDMKICLAIALGSSFILGYLYTKFRARDKYKPQLNQYTDIMDEYSVESAHTKKESAGVKYEIDQYKSDLKNQKELSLKNYDTLKKIQDQKLKSDKELENMNALHLKKSKILNDYHTEVASIKGDFGLEDGTNIQDHKDSMRSKLDSSNLILKSKSEDFDNIMLKQKDLQKSDTDLNSKINTLKATQSKKNLELSSANETLSTLKSKLQGEFNALAKTKEDNLFLIGKYKQKLLDIKDSIS